MIKKIGSPVKIGEIAVNEEDFKKMWATIEKKNDLIRCPNCLKVISKRYNDLYTLKKGDLSAIVSEAVLTCPSCKHITSVGR